MTRWGPNVLPGNNDGADDAAVELRASAEAEPAEDGDADAEGAVDAADDAACAPVLPTSSRHRSLAFSQLKWLPFGNSSINIR